MRERVVCERVCVCRRVVCARKLRECSLCSFALRVVFLLLLLSCGLFCFIFIFSIFIFCNISFVCDFVCVACTSVLYASVCVFAGVLCDCACARKLRECPLCVFFIFVWFIFVYIIFSFV